jgi:serine/threonine protein kinases
MGLDERQMKVLHFHVRVCRAFFVCCLLLVVSAVSAQHVYIPFARNDSAARMQSDSLYHYYLDQGNLKEAARQLDQNAMLFWVHNSYDKAIEYFMRSLELNKRLGNQNGIAGINSNLAFIYADKGDYPNAYDYFEITLAVRKAKGDMLGVVSALVNESVVLNDMQRYEESVAKLEEGLRLARQSNNEKQMRSIYGMLTETYQKWGKTDKAMYYYEYYRSFNEYVVNQKVKQAHEELELQRVEQEKLILENRNKELEIAIRERENAQKTEQLLELTAEQRQLVDSLARSGRLRAALEAEKRTKELENERLITERRNTIWFLAGVLIVAALLVVFLVYVILDRRRKMRLNAQIKEQRNELAQLYTKEKSARELLAKKNDEIQSSILYSKNIQDAVMGHNMPPQELCADAMMYNRPLAIVSGDFYYTRKLPTGETIIALGDCTGHGVPGAFLTILGMMTLDKAIYDHKLTECNDILRVLDAEIRVLNEKNEIPYHSMEISLCIIDKEKKVLRFAGSRTGMLVARAGGTEIINGSYLILGHRNALMGEEPPMYPVHELPLEEGTWYYIFSDGICDQFGTKGERFSKRRVKATIDELHGMTGEQQLEHLSDVIREWQGKVEQTDDILVLGFRPI